jgi:hypothetical protein
LDAKEKEVLIAENMKLRKLIDELKKGNGSSISANLVIDDG